MGGFAVALTLGVEWCLLFGAIMLGHRQIDAAADWLERQWPSERTQPTPSAMINPDE